MDLHSQKYNPEVPTLSADHSMASPRVQQLNDQLISAKNLVNKQVKFNDVNGGMLIVKLSTLLLAFIAHR